MFDEWSLRSEPWMTSGACRTSGLTADTWFPHKDDHKTKAVAKTVCHTCPVISDCLDYALTHREERGIWGGLSPRERRTLRERHAVRH